MARPKPLEKLHAVQCRMPAIAKEKLELEAAQANRSLAQHLYWIILQHLARNKE